MRILLTGATGFLGSHLLHRLVTEGHEVIIAKRSTSDLWRIQDVIKEVSSYDVDMISIEKIFLDNSNIEAVIHTATSYGRGNETAISMVEDNILFSLNLLENAVRYNTDSFYNTDSSQHKSLNAYALTKHQFVEWGYYFTDISKINFINLKLEHMYGTKDATSKFIPYVVEQCLQNVPEVKLTAGEQHRDFIHVDDVVEAYLKILSTKHNGFSSYDVGSGSVIRLRDLVTKIGEITKTTSKLNFGALPYRKNEIMRSNADIAKLLNLGWKPMIDLDQGLREFIDYMSCMRIHGPTYYGK